jgi:DNA-binding transcriptional LysR family regulator
VDLNPRLLRYIVTVADVGHFERAAAKLFITPPELTQQIRRLEHAVGFSLLDRAQHPVVPTPSGQAFLRSSDRALIVLAVGMAALTLLIITHGGTKTCASRALSAHSGGICDS